MPAWRFARTVACVAAPVIDIRTSVAHDVRRSRVEFRLARRVEAVRVAVDYSHRLITEGPPATVARLRDDLHAAYPRVIKRKTWIEVVPFSFERLYALAPAARRIERDVPYDPYDLSVWPIRRFAPRRALLRYQFHTRNLEVDRLLRPLSRVYPSLRFVLATFCVDDSSVSTYLLSRGKRAPGSCPTARWNTSGIWPGVDSG